MCRLVSRLTIDRFQHPFTIEPGTCDRQRGIMSVDSAAATIPAPPASTELSPGDVVGDRYRVQARLGEGSMGVVYRVEHVHMRKSFALKVLDPEWAKTPDAFARFEREAVAAGSIASPHVAQATDFGRLADGSCFLVLEYVGGRTLRAVLGRAMPPNRALWIARGIVAATEAAHAQGVVHRDLKPENIMLVDREGDPDFVKVLDFGLAKLVGAAAEAPSSRVLTRTGAIVGTPRYMAPEQATGQRIDARADLYSIGAILFEMLTGSVPFEGDPMSVLRQLVLYDVPPPLPRSVQSAVGPRVEQMVGRLLAKAPKARFASASELAVELDGCLAALTQGGETRTGERPRPPAPSGDHAAARERKELKTIASVPAALPAASPVAWLQGLSRRLRLQRQRRPRALELWDALVGHVRARRRKRRLREWLAIPEQVVGDLREWLARRGLKLTVLQLSLALAAAAAALLLVTSLAFLL
jgi:serine/threonine-protein kinase